MLGCHSAQAPSTSIELQLKANLRPSLSISTALDSRLLPYRPIPLHPSVSRPKRATGIQCVAFRDHDGVWGTISHFTPFSHAISICFARNDSVAIGLVRCEATSKSWVQGPRPRTASLYARLGFASQPCLSHDTFRKQAMVQVWSLPFPKSSSVPGDGRIVAKILPGGGNGLESISYQYPLKLISPTSPTGGQKSVLVFILSYGGGLVGGDAVNLSIHVQAGANLSLVTQGHTKVFKSPSADVITSQLMSVKIDKGAALCLLPDPVQPFEDSVYTQTQIFNLAQGSSLCLLDWVTAGRTARGENWSFINWTGRNEVWLRGDEQGARDRLLVRDTVILSQDGTQAIGQQLRDTMHKMSVFGTLILRGHVLEDLGSFFLAEFDALPRLGSRDFRTQEDREEETEKMTDFERWRARRLEKEVRDGVLWSAARVRGCVVVKFGTPTVEAGRDWIGSMLTKEGSIYTCFGEEALMCVH